MIFVNKFLYFRVCLSHVFAFDKYHALRKKFPSHSAKNIRGRDPSVCLRKIGFQKNMPKRGYHNFCQNIFVSQCRIF